MDWSFIFTCLSLPTSIYGIYELIRKLMINLRKSNSKSIVWKNKKEWVIILPQYSGNYRRVEDTIASEKIYTYCNRLGLNCTIQDDLQPIPAEKNLILVCGPKANKATNRLYNDYFKIHFNNEQEEISLFDSLGDCKYTSLGNDVKKDYAIMSRYIDPQTNRICIFCAGIHGLGTLGSASILTNHKLARYIRKSESFESIISVSSIDNYFSIGSVDFIIPPRKI